MLYVCAVVESMCGVVLQAQTGEGGGKQGGENPTSTEVKEDDANVSGLIVLSDFTDLGGVVCGLASFPGPIRKSERGLVALPYNFCRLCLTNSRGANQISERNHTQT